MGLRRKLTLIRNMTYEVSGMRSTDDHVFDGAVLAWVGNGKVRDGEGSTTNTLPGGIVLDETMDYLIFRHRFCDLLSQLDAYFLKHGST